MKPSRITRPGYILAILVVLFLIPLVLAWVLYLERNPLHNKMTNHGYLITPPFPISAIKLSSQIPTGKWILMYLYPQDCQKLCKKGLYNMRQIRIATGKERNRIERVIITYQNNSKTTHLKKLLAKEFKGTKLLTTSKRSFENTIKENVKEPYATSPGTLYIVDPHGNVMMLYKANANPNGIYKDVRRLLRASQIG